MDKNPADLDVMTAIQHLTKAIGAGGVLRDHRLEHHEREPGRQVVLQLLLVQGELAGALADRMGDRPSQVSRAQIDAVGLADVVGQIPRQLALEALEITRESLAHPGPRARLHGALLVGGEVPRDRHRSAREWRLPLPRPTASGGYSPPSDG